MPTKITIKQRKAIWNRHWLPRPRSRRAKALIVILSITSVCSFLVLVFPYLPHLSFLFRQPKIDATPYAQAAQQSRQSGDDKPAAPEEQKPTPGNRLILPDIGVNAQIIEGNNIYVIGKNQGVWRESRQVDPTKPGNVVLAGHRFLYTASNGGYFYNLPELKIGKRIYIRWKDIVYEYDIFNTRTVLPTQVDIRNNDPNVPYKLTMYTCYPLGSTSKRFVVEAKQIR